ncbi:hypothetical protein DFJ73DRAFT_775702 [Zopfochytrium polystomum]|nr:hypothetical protein DFJ73DRAFT_775702 [Zopfochytrium polystomum]
MALIFKSVPLLAAVIHFVAAGVLLLAPRPSEAEVLYHVLMPVVEGTVFDEVAYNEENVVKGGFDSVSDGDQDGIGFCSQTSLGNLSRTTTNLKGPIFRLRSELVHPLFKQFYFGDFDKLATMAPAAAAAKSSVPPSAGQESSDPFPHGNVPPKHHLVFDNLRRPALQRRVHPTKAVPQPHSRVSSEPVRHTAAMSIACVAVVDAPMRASIKNVTAPRAPKLERVDANDGLKGRCGERDEAGLQHCFEVLRVAVCGDAKWSHSVASVQAAIAAAMLASGMRFSDSI